MGSGTGPDGALVYVSLSVLEAQREAHRHRAAIYLYYI